jgi:penicillin-binding protein 2
MQRLIVLRIILIGAIAILIGRLYQLQLVDSDARRYGGNSIEVNTTRYVPVLPRRGEILASDGKTLLAESVPTFNIAVMPGSLPPHGSERRDDVLGRLAHIAGITCTLTLSPSVELESTPELRRTLARMGDTRSLSPTATLVAHSAPEMTISITPAHTLEALELARTYEDVLTFHNPVEAMIDRSNTRHYQSAVIKENISQHLALAIRENMMHMPGVLVVEHYQRRYPLSANIPSLSHILGHIRRINECELVSENPATSWVDSLVDVIGHTVHCGVQTKTIEPGVIGLLPYQHDDRIGKDGLEAGYETELRGRMGIESLLVDALERPVSSNRTMHAVDDGKNLILTIDPDFQYETEIILRRWIAEGERRREEAEDYRKEYDPIRSGVAVVMDPRNGHVLAMVSLPAYDNNILVDPSRSNELQQLLYPDDPQQREELKRLSPLTNRALSGQYPPGSSLKQFVGSAALQKGIVEATTTLRDPGRIILEERGGHIFVLPNSTPRDNGEITISDALKVSSNVFFASIAGGNDEAVNLGPDDTRIKGLKIAGLSEGLEWFGFGEPTTIRLPGEAAGRVPDPVWKSHELREPWTTGDTYNTAIGQGYMEVTPLQLVTAASAVANGGTLYRPQMVKAITTSNGEVVAHPEAEMIAHVPVDNAHLAVIREGMHRSVTEGLNVAARQECSGLDIAGKTGTAEFGPLIEKEDGIFARQSHAWFVGFAPFDDPQLIVVVLVEGTGDLNDGSATIAVPAVTQIMQTYFGIAPPPDPPSICPVLPQDNPLLQPEPETSPQEGGEPEEETDETDETDEDAEIASQT